MEDGIALFSSNPAPKTKKRKVQKSDKPNNENKKSKDSLEELDNESKLHHQTDNETHTFKDLSVSNWLEKVCSGLGMLHPTQVQRACIPAILSGRDVIGVAHTGSGKTAAFALPILQKLAHNPYGVFALVLTPTRELAFQLAEQFRALGSGTSLKDAVIIGGLDMQQQVKDLAQRPHVVIATPGRLHGILDMDSTLHQGFSRTSFLVLDEADRLLEPSFEEDVAAILSVLPSKRQTLLFSATMTKTLVTLQNKLLQDAFYFEAYEGLETSKTLKEQYLLVPAKVKEVYLAHILESIATAEHSVHRSVIVFVSTCKGCALLASMLQELEMNVAALHSHLPQNQRMASLHKFRSGASTILLATDVASRGLDIPTVDMVINFDLPLMARDYVHRVGRTARAGRAGWSLSFVSQYDIELVQKIEDMIGHKMEKYDDVEEQEVLKGITKVYAARRAALLKIADEKERRKSMRGGGRREGRGARPDQRENNNGGDDIGKKEKKKRMK